MSNPIKYSTGSESLALKKGNFYIGTGDVGKGPTSSTGYYNGITPPTGGYTIYLNKASGGPSIYTASNDAQLISLTNAIAGQSYTTVNECLIYFAGQTDKICLNRDYEGIVTDGLVFNLDAGFTPSYPKNGTTFYDVSGTNNGTLINGPTYSSSNGGSIVFDGSDDYVNIGTTDFNITRDFTVSFWMDITKNGSINIFNKGYNSPWGIYIDKQHTNVLSCQLSFSPSGFGQVDTITQSYSGIKNWVVVRNNNVMSWYVNGTQNNTGTINTNNINQSNSKSWRIGGNVDNPGIPTFQGNIYNQLIYNRALSAIEVLQNYNAQKGRFGL